MRQFGAMEIDWTAPVGRLGVQRLGAAAVGERLRLTVVSAGYAVLAALSLSMSIAAIVSFAAIAVFGLGFVLLLGVVPAVQVLAGAHRTVSGMLLGEQLPTSYRDVDEVSVRRRPLAWGRDPARWRDLAGVLFAATVGFVLSVLPVALVSVPVVTAFKGITGEPSELVRTVVLGVPAVVLWWVLTPMLVKARAVADRSFFSDTAAQLAARLSVVEETRAESLDHSAAEIRRIERDLHDGAQARMAAVGMSVGLAEKLVMTDPDAALALLREARQTAVSAMEDLRGVVRGIMPPVLADRGLSEAVKALTANVALPTSVDCAIPRLPLPIESAAYFAVAECVANAVKHAEATAAFVHGSHDGSVLRLVVGDDGRGGAAADGHGLTGLARRLAAFDGTVAVASPPGGPTTITMELPCQA
jgi:signal transduction histidine kinase